MLPCYALLISCSTIWYEIIAGEFPFRRVAPEVVIWQVGSGIKQPLNFSAQASKDVKVGAPSTEHLIYVI